MKARLSIILFIVSASLAALLLVQWRQLSSQKNLTEKLQFQVEEMQGEIQSARREKEAIEQENATLQQQLRNAQLQAASPRQDLSNPAAGTPPAVNPASASSPDSSRKSAAHPLAMVAEMMKDPDTRKGLEQQQMMGINMIYGPLFKKLNLTDEQQDAFKKLMLEQQMAGMELATSMMGSEPGSQEAAGESFAADKAARDEKIREILGDEGFAAMEEYNLTVGERMMMGQQMDLPPEQFEQLLGIIAEEKRALANTQMPGMDPAQNPAALLQEGFVEKHLADQETINTIVYERARSMLTPEQLQNLAEFQKDEITRQRAQILMARKMMQPDAGLAPAPITQTE